MRFYSLISSLILSVFLLFISDSESVKTLKHLTVRSGGSLSVPCLYEEKYKSNPKYWCSGYYWYSCTIVAYTNSSNKGISVTDHPSQNMFTVNLTNLQPSDSGYYQCGVEIGGFETRDDLDYVYLTISGDPAVWVENSRVRGHEGGNASVQGFYSSEYKKKEKKWCRVKDWSCHPFQSPAVKISDDGRRSFTVEMTGLQKSDAGWYWFSVGGVGVTVHLTVTKKRTKTTASTTQTTSTLKSILILESTKSPGNTNDQAGGTTMSVWVLLVVGLVLLLVLFSFLICMLKKTCKGNQKVSKERSNDIVNSAPMTSTTEDTLLYSTIIHEKKKPSSSAGAPENDVTYTSVRRSRRNKTSSSALDHESDVTYSSVRKSQKCKNLSPAVGDDGVIYSSVLHEQEVYANVILQSE